MKAKKNYNLHERTDDMVMMIYVYIYKLKNNALFFKEEVMRLLGCFALFIILNQAFNSCVSMQDIYGNVKIVGVLL